MNKVVNQVYLFFFSLVFFFLFLIQLNITIINLVMYILTKTKKFSLKKKKGDRLKKKSMKGASIPLPKNISLSPREKGKEHRLSA